MPKISLVYNLDSRPKLLDAMTTTADCDGGCRCVDFFTHGLINKINFSSPYELEVIVYVDVHDPVPCEALDFFEKMKDEGHLHQLVMEPHTKERWGQRYGKCNNDLLYVEALSLATGDYIVHIDADMILYRKPAFDFMGTCLEWLKEYNYVSLPGDFSPDCGRREDWPHLDYWWASTRFLVCKKETLPPKDELLKCFNNQYLQKAYGKLARPNCLEHILGVIAGDGNIFYPPNDLDNYLIASWQTYWKGTIEKLNQMPYEQVKAYIVEKCGGLHGANDVVGQPL